jgi:tetratricopeptide (TPR) repeat protein
MSQFAVGDTKKAERNLYFIWPLSGYFGEREYHLGRLAFLRKDLDQAAGHLERAIVANGYDLGSRLLLALTFREQGKKDEALKQLAEVEKADPTDRPAVAERFFLTGDPAARTELQRLMGGQSQEAIDVSTFYRQVERWKEAAGILRMVEQDNKDVWGTPPEFYYTLAYCLERTGDRAQAAEYRKKARAAAGNVDRFPDRQESEAPLEAAIQADPKDAVARFNLACLLYYRERHAEAIKQWEAAVQTDPANFSARRALGLAYAEQGYPVEKAAAELEKAVELRPAHLATLNDLSAMYARAGRFDEQLVALKKALARSPNDDNVAQGLLGAYLVKGQYGEADKLVNTHRFEPHHRTYGLRDKYRFMRYGEGAAAFNNSSYADALRLWESALKPPVSLGVDNFANDMAPRVNYYMGRALEALGRKAEAQQAYEKGTFGAAQMSTGEKDVWTGENFHIVLALERLGRNEQAAKLRKQFEDFAQSQMESKYQFRRAEARYILGLIRKHDGQNDEARKLMEAAVQILPDFLAPRYELRGDSLKTF